jgi:hypothetical protein
MMYIKEICPVLCPRDFQGSLPILYLTCNTGLRRKVDARVDLPSSPSSATRLLEPFISLLLKCSPHSFENGRDVKHSVAAL